jgi:RecB family exonuclease
VATEASIIFDLNPCLPQAGSTLAKEDKNGIKFRGFIDRLDKEGETFIINDYKTNKNLPPESKEEYREQLTLYGLGVQQNYAKYFKNIKARLHYLHFDLMDEWDITPQLLDTVTKKYADTITDIEDKKFHYNMGNKKTFEPKQNNFCKYCEYYSLCPLRAHLKFDDEVVGGDLGQKTVKGLVDEYVSLSKQ